MSFTSNARARESPGLRKGKFYLGVQNGESKKRKKLDPFVSYKGGDIHTPSGKEKKMEPFVILGPRWRGFYSKGPGISRER